MYFVMLLFFINHNLNGVQSLTCDELLELPDEKTLNLQELQTMPPKDIVQCLVHLSRNKLVLSEAEHIWNAIIEFHDGISNIPDEVLMSLKWVTIALTPEDYANITLSNIDVITNFGQDYNLNSAQLSAIAERVREDFGSKEPEDFTVFDLTALRQILCAFNRSEIERIHPSAYKEAAFLIGKIKHCSSEVLKGFAFLATQKGGFGPTKFWVSGTIEILGYIAEYFPKDVISKIKDRKDEDKIIRIKDEYK